MFIHRKRLGAVFLLVVLAWFCAPTMAQDAQLVTVTNTTGQAVSDLHVIFSGTGGVVQVDPNTVVTTNCPVPIVPSNPPAVTNTVTIDWQTPCVQPGETVAFMVTTPNGPLNYQGGWWTLNGVNVGNIRVGSINITRVRTPFGVPGVPGGPAPYGAYKVQVRYVPCGVGLYTPWYTANFRCWFRICCFPSGFACYYRVVYCPFLSPWARFWEFFPWYSLTPWIKGGKTGPIYFRQRLTYEPKEVHVVVPAPKGPVPDLPEKSDFALKQVWNQALDVSYSDDNGASFRAGSDFTSAFYDVSNALALAHATPEEPMTFEENILDLAPRYKAASDALTPLINEVIWLMDMDPDASHQASLMSIHGDLTALQTALCDMAQQFEAGGVESSDAFFNAEAAMKNLASTLRGLAPDLRLENGADTLEEAAVGMNIAGLYFEQGIDDPTNQDYLLWGLINRFQPVIGQFATAMSPHVRLDATFNDFEWCRSNADGIAFKIQNANDGTLDDEGTAFIADSDRFYLPIVASGNNVNIWLKPPTHLSRVVSDITADGLQIDAGTFIPGDANGDNCIDDQDLAQVIEEQGMGGPEGEFVPSSDVNYDGIVDEEDLALVEEHLGQCGQALPLIAKEIDQVQELSPKRSAN